MSSGSATEVIPGGQLHDGMEWLEADGLGGFASGTATGVRTRRYHALLLTATQPPTGRMALVNGVEAWVERDGRAEVLTPQRYSGGVSRGARIESFTPIPWPSWVYVLEDGTRVRHDVFVPRGRACVVLSWSVEGLDDRKLRVRPLLSGRDYHALHSENVSFDMRAIEGRGVVSWGPYHGVPGVVCASNGVYTHAPDWYRGFSYAHEQSRGFDHVEDLATPGFVEFDRVGGESLMVLASEAERERLQEDLEIRGLRGTVEEWRRAEGTRRAGPALDAAADAYVVKRGGGTTITAGYPWFTDWGRDAMISVRGLCTARGRLDEAAEVLSSWAGAVSGGLLPNRFCDSPGDIVEYNSVDAPLWFCVAAYELLRAYRERDGAAPLGLRGTLTGAVREIVERYAAGTAMGIGMDESDALLWSGTPGTNLTWMDARVRGQPITGRIGKPVEVQALWVHALCIAGKSDPKYKELSKVAQRSLVSKFWNERLACLYDVIDLDHRRGTADTSVRPNQIFAVGGLPKNLLPADRARCVVDTVERELLTPAGLRSLAAWDDAYRGRYQGGPDQRDSSYHQGTAWSWLLGPFVEAWVRVRGSTDESMRHARERFLEPLIATGFAFGLGHIGEIADGDAPHGGRGCPFQAWSVAEAIRLDRVVLKHRDTSPPKAAKGSVFARSGRSGPVVTTQGGVVWRGTGALR